MEEKKMQNVSKDLLKNPKKVRETIAFLEEVLAAMPDEASSKGHKNEVKQQPTTSELRNRAAEHLKKLGVPQHIKGYLYLEYGIAMTAKNLGMVDAITKELYPAIAKKYSTTPSRVERAIRHAIEVCYDRGDMEVLEEYFGNTISRFKGKPTNSEFMALMGNLLRREMGMEEDD